MAFSRLPAFFGMQGPDRSHRGALAELRMAPRGPKTLEPSKHQAACNLIITLYKTPARSSSGAAVSQSGLNRSSRSDGPVKFFAFFSNSFASFSQAATLSLLTALVLMVARQCQRAVREQCSVRGPTFLVDTNYNKLCTYDHSFAQGSCHAKRCPH